MKNQPEPLPEAFSHKQSASAHVAVIPKICQWFANCKQVVAGLSMLFTSCNVSWSPAQVLTGFNLHCNSHQRPHAWHKMHPVLPWNDHLPKWPLTLHKWWLNSACIVVPSLPLVAAAVHLQHSHSQVPPSPAQAATNHRSICSFHQAVTSQTQAAVDLCTSQSPS